MSGSYSVPGDFPTVAVAIGSLNSVGISGPVTVNIAAGFTETSPVGGYSLYATGTSTSPIIFQKSGTGANPLLTAYGGGTAVPSSAAQDGIWRLIGSDYITIDGIDLVDPNTSNPSTMEFGYGLFKSNITNGCRYNTIKNCVITLNRVNSPLGTGVGSEGSRGIDMVNSTTSAHTTALAITTAFGSNSYNKFYSNLIQNCNIGIAMIGFADVSPFTFADQYNDVGGNSASTGNTILNFGGGVDATNPPASGIKTLAQYFINMSYNVINSNNGSGVDHIFRLYGINSQAALSANLSITNNTIAVKSTTSSFTLSAIENLAGSTAASNTIEISNNLITNCTYSTSTSSSGTFFGINNNGAAAVVILNNNTVSNNMSSATGGNYTCIQNSGNSPNITINNNLASGNSVTVAAASGNVFFIQNTGAASGGTISINSNTIQSLSLGSASARTFICIRNTATTGSTGKNSISNNIFNALSLQTTGSVFLIDNSTSTGNSNVSNNIINGSFSKLNGGGTVYGYFNNGSVAAGTATVMGNNFSGITVNGSTNFYGIYHSTTSNHIVAMSNNTISNISAAAGGINGIYFASTISSMLQSNVISNYTCTGSLAGIYVSAPTGVFSVADNTISSLVGTGPIPMYGYYEFGGQTVNIYRNKIYDLLGTDPATEVDGLSVNGTITNTNIYNNMIGDLRAPVANNWNVVNGIYINGGGTHNVSYNTVRLNATSTGFDFGSSAIYSVVTPTLNLRNNMFINLSTPNGSAYSVAFRRSTIGLTTYSGTSNNNLFYAGTPSASNLIFSDATNFMQTLSAYKSFISPRDASSITENTSFLSTTGSSPNFLHVNPVVVSLAESQAINISGITTDFDISTRQGNAGYVGTGLAPDIGADEFETIYPNCTTATAASISPSSYVICTGQPISFTGTISAPPAPGIEYTWKIASAAGGPYTTIPSATGFSYTNTNPGAGTYYYVLATTCTITSQTIVSNEATVTVYPYPALTVSPANFTMCMPGGFPVALNASGANSYTWSPSTGLSSTNGSTVTALPTVTQTYVVTGANPAGCTGSASAVINVIPGAGGITVTATPTLLCQGASANLNVIATSSVYAVSPISFSPIPTPTSGVGNACINGTDITGLAQGNLDNGNWYSYSLPFNFTFFGTVYNTYGLSTNGFMTLGQGPVTPNTFSGYGIPFPSFSAGRPSIGAVYGDLTFVSTGTINLFTSGTAPNRRFVVNWSNGRYAASSSGTITTQIILYETSNFIEVHTTRNTGQYAAVEGIQDASGSIATVVPGRNSQTFNITNDAYRWSPTLTYAWTPSSFLSSSTSSNPVASNLQSNISFTAIALAANGCTMGAVTTLSVKPSPTISISGGTTPLCAGTTLSLTASGANTYTWTGGPTNATYVPSPLITTTYIVTGTGTLNTCTAAAAQVVTVNPNPTITISGSSAICVNQSATLAATGADTYSWNAGPSTSTISVPSSTTGTTIYSVTGTSTLGGCMASASNIVTVYANPTVAITGSSLICSGQSATLIGSGATSYSWSDGSSGLSIFPVPISNTIYSVTGISSPANCAGQAVFSVSLTPTPTVSISGTNTLCIGQSVIISASGASTYSWNTGASSYSISISPLATGIFAVTGTNSANGCINSSNLLVYVYPLPVITFAPLNASVCPGTPASYTAFGATTYTWLSTGNNSAVLTITPTAPAQYVVSGSINGCVSNQTLFVKLFPPALIVASPTVETICAGEIATFMATGGNTYTWTPDNAAGSIFTISPAFSETYTVTGTDGNNCMDSETVELIVDACLGVAEKTLTNFVKVFPNPSSGIVQTVFEVEGLKTIHLINTVGEIIETRETTNTRETFDFSGYAKGFYFLKIRSGSSSVGFKLLIQ